MKEYKFKYGTVKVNDSQKIKDAVFDKLIKDYYIKYGSFTGESIMQSDDPQIYAAELLSNIADDIIKFKVDWKD